MILLAAETPSADSSTGAPRPTTLELTTLGRAGVGTSVNLEVDIIAKYVERLLDARDGSIEASGD